jgi:hypothetical protein
MMPRVWSNDPRRKPLGVLQGRVGSDLDHRDVGARVGFIEPRLARQVKGRLRDRKAAGVPMVFGLDFGRGE